MPHEASQQQIDENYDQLLEQERTLLPDETFVLPGFANTLPDHEDGQEQTLEIGDGRIIHGAEALTVRIGGDNEFVDAKIIDIRGQAAIGAQTDPLGNPIALRQIGYDVNGKAMTMAGDFLLVIPSKNGEAAVTRTLIPGMALTLGREQVGGEKSNPGLLPSTVSRDHCAVGLDTEGNLRVENHNPVNSTKILPPKNREETVLRSKSAVKADLYAASAEGEQQISEETAIGWLSYSDVLQDAASRDSAVEWTKASPNGMKYARELQTMVAEFGIEKIIATAQELHAQCLKALEELGVPPSVYTESFSWVLWDLAKQRYMSKHPQETAQEYRDHTYFDKIGDPMTEGNDGENKRRNIVNRHVGWEVSRVLDSGEMHVVDIAGLFPMHRADLESDLAKADRNETGQLRSYALAQLGRRTLRYAGLALTP